MLFLLARQKALGLVTLSGQQAHGLGEGPLQMGVADLGAAATGYLARRSLHRTHQAGVRQKLPFRGKAADVVDLVKQHQAQDLAHARNRTQPIERVHLDGAIQIQLDVADDFVQGIQEPEINLNVGADTGIGEALGDLQGGAVPGVDQLLAEGGQVVLAVGVDEVGDDLRPLVYQVHAAAQKITGLAQALGINVADGQVAATQQEGNLF